MSEASKHKAYAQRDGLNHVALVCDDLSSTEDRVPKYFEIYSHADYELGKRFYFHDDDGTEYEMVFKVKFEQFSKKTNDNDS